MIPWRLTSSVQGGSMQVPRVDIISVFDLSFRRMEQTALDRLRAQHTNRSLARIYMESFDWLFYRAKATRGASEVATEIDYALPAVIDDASLGGFQRFCVAAS